MYRNGVLYRRIWYAKHRRSRRLCIYFYIAVFIFVLAATVTYAEKMLEPYVEEYARARAATVLTDAAYESAGRVIAGLKYDDLVSLQKDSAGRVLVMQTNMQKINLITSEVTRDVQKAMADMLQESTRVPFGALLGKTIFSGAGPDIIIKTAQVGRVEADCHSELTKIEGGKSRHRLILAVKAMVAFSAPFGKNITEVNVEVPLTETILPGDFEQSGSGLRALKN